MNEFANFEAVISPWLRSYTRTTFSYVALRTNDALQLLYGKIVFEALNFASMAPMEYETRHLVAGVCQKTSNEETVAQTLKAAEAGAVICGTRKLTLSKYQSRSFSPWLQLKKIPFSAELFVRGASRRELLSGID